jgi:hypothetical protein
VTAGGNVPAPAAVPSILGGLRRYLQHEEVKGGGGGVRTVEIERRWPMKGAHRREAVGNGDGLETGGAGGSGGRRWAPAVSVARGEREE